MILSAPGITASAVACCTWRIITSRPEKQWSWGHGEFGQAWDRQLTDENGPYIELMTGVYTDNQPDFTACTV